MNWNSSSSSSTSYGEIFTSSSSYSGPICTPALIVPLRVIYDSESILVNDIPSILTKKDVDCLHNHYQISREIFRVYTPSPSICMDNQILVKDTIMVYKEQLKADLQFFMDPFFYRISPITQFVSRTTAP